jgi:glutathione S-transferase
MTARSQSNAPRRLHVTPLEPASRSVKLALHEKRLDFDVTDERPWERAPSFLVLNHAGETPVLVDSPRDLAEGNCVVCGAGVILEYLEEAYGGPALLPEAPGERAEVRRLMAWFERLYAPQAGWPLLFERVEKRRRGLGSPDMGVIKDALLALRWHLDYVSFLAERRHWLAGQIFTLADVMAAAHLSCADYVCELPWDHFPEAKAWYARAKSRPAMRTILKERLPGTRPPPHYDDPDF